MKTLIITLTLSLAVALCSAAPAAAKPPRWEACSGIDRSDLVSRQTEVAVAYAYAIAQRQAYYRLGHRKVLTRYRDPARAQILKSVAGYPVEAHLPSWCIASVRIQGNWATITSRERWRVRWSERSYSMSTRRAFTVRLREVPGLVSQRWVVTSIRSR